MKIDITLLFINHTYECTAFSLDIQCYDFDTFKDKQRKKICYSNKRWDNVNTDWAMENIFLTQKSVWSIRVVKRMCFTNFSIHYTVTLSSKLSLKFLMYT